MKLEVLMLQQQNRGTFCLKADGLVAEHHHFPEQPGSDLSTVDFMISWWVIPSELSSVDFMVA